MGQREGHSIIFYNRMVDADFTQLLFGHGGGWGGLSNIYFEMIYRLGILIYLILITIIFTLNYGFGLQYQLFCYRMCLI